MMNQPSTLPTAPRVLSTCDVAPPALAALAGPFGETEHFAENALERIGADLAILVDAFERTLARDPEELREVIHVLGERASAAAIIGRQLRARPHRSTPQQLGERLRTLGRVQPDAPVDAKQVARRVLGRSGVLRVPSLKTTPAMIALLDGEWTIAYRPGEPDENFNIAHELGHFAIRVLDGRPQHTEREADEVAAAFLGVPIVHEPHAGVRREMRGAVTVDEMAGRGRGA